jgi:hypothetical protein
MNNTILQIKIKERLNKLSSNDYDNIECWQISEAFNKAQLEFVRRCINGYNNRKEGDEGSKMSIDDLQVLLLSADIAATKYDTYYETAVLPDNYFYYKRVAANITTECCDPRPLNIYLANVADVDILLVDQSRCPSIEWGETFCTLSSNRIKIYTKGLFEIDTPKLFYYKQPPYIQISGCVDITTGTIITTNVECIFKDDIVELIIDDTAYILAGDIESMVQIQRNKQNSTLNT